MLARFQYHLRGTHDRLSGKFVSLCARHTAQYCGICHRFDKHEDIRRGGAADANHRMNHRLGNHFGFAKAAENIQHIRGVFRGNQRVWCH
ncbi:hypothetical protein SDC9_156381 [bioreactor metagenome]|uniref:Uncharacterized protein n=1 Tax=bioreactor metagenome TaxID=1076179 RepID=A0A645F9F0_9ZZZZ